MFLGDVEADALVEERCNDTEPCSAYQREVPKLLVLWVPQAVVQFLVDVWHGAGAALNDLQQELYWQRPCCVLRSSE